MSERKPPPPRMVDTTALKGLAHPLRVRLYELLSEGPATASQLASRLGESSGATSYHLRQLGRHGFITEDSDRGRGRERWWKVVPGGFRLEAWRYLDDPDASSAHRLIAREVYRGYARELGDWFTDHASWPQDWQLATVDSSFHVQLTREELAALVGDVQAVLDAYRARAAYREPPDDSEQVAVQFHAFPRRTTVAAPPA